MRYLFAPEGQAALARLARERTLYAFDFDGTLAPIVALPERAQMSLQMRAALEALAQAAEVAVISGRALADLAPRLPEAVRWRLGNHGNEGLAGLGPDPAAARAACRAWLAALGVADLPGVLVEDKGVTLSLHYRLAPDRARTHALLHERIAALAPAPRVQEGKCVLNLLPAGALSKREGLAALARACGCTHAFFIGDDVTDEDVFEDAPAEWCTVRVESARDSAAGWFVGSQLEVLRVLQTLRGLLSPAGRAAPG